MAIRRRGLAAPPPPACTLCARGEGCYICGKCLEGHCVCPGGGRARRLRCLESRACACVVSDPTVMRCALCRGCRQPPDRLSHCHCVEHEKLWKILRDDDGGADGSRAVDASCSCFLLHPLQSTEASTAARNAKCERAKRLARARRIAGFPSIDSLYRRKVSTVSIGSDDEDECDEIDDADEVVRFLPRSMARSVLGQKLREPTVPQLHNEGSSMRESLEARTQAFVASRMAVH